jgi:head-tail adaptor
MPFGQAVQRLSPTLNVGRLRHRVSIVRTANTQDSAGGQSLSNVVLYANVWATIEALNGNESFAAKEFMSKSSHYVLIRYIGAAPSWLAGQQYLSGALVKDSNNNLQQSQTPTATSGAQPPTWATGLNSTTTDSGITWKNVGPAPERTGVTAAMQVYFRGRLFQIESVLNPNEQNKMLVLLCTEINDSQQLSANPGAAIG